jgi:hypothetical protein
MFPCHGLMQPLNYLNIQLFSVTYASTIRACLVQISHNHQNCRNLLKMLTFFFSVIIYPKRKSEKEENGHVNNPKKPPYTEKDKE